MERYELRAGNVCSFLNTEFSRAEINLNFHCLSTINEGGLFIKEITSTYHTAERVFELF